MWECCHCFDIVENHRESLYDSLPTVVDTSQRVTPNTTTMYLLPIDMQLATINKTLRRNTSQIDKYNIFQTRHVYSLM